MQPGVSAAVTQGRRSRALASMGYVGRAPCACSGLARPPSRRSPTASLRCGPPRRLGGPHLHAA
eukprot:7965180-Lingulodinium_polyedra.AAC.1